MPAPDTAAPPPADAAPARPLPSLWWFVPPLVLTAVLDLWTKAWFFDAPLDELRLRWLGHPVIHPDINTGVAWSLGNEHPGIIAALTVLLVPVLFVMFFRHFRKDGRFLSLIFGLILGGALGNAYDRVLAAAGVLGYAGVRDFISIDLGFYIWPTFNVADMGITGGFIGLVVTMAFAPRRATPATPSKTGT